MDKTVEPIKDFIERMGYCNTKPISKERALEVLKRLKLEAMRDRKRYELAMKAEKKDNKHSIERYEAYYLSKLYCYDCMQAYNMAIRLIKHS